jgi:predicted naringenin-chalcone synthase
MLTLRNFSLRRPRHEVSQEHALEWLVRAHAAAESKLQGLSSDERGAFAQRMRAFFRRCACGPDKIAKRGHSFADLSAADFDTGELYDVLNHPHGRGSEVRTHLFARVVNDYFTAAYADEVAPPSELIHVTCTGYLSPSGAQRLVADKGWGNATRVTHAYHMGCYAAFPALRLAAGALSLPKELRRSSAEQRVDIVHTELCSLHLDPSDHSMEQCVVQSLFADGLIRYSLVDEDDATRARAPAPGLAVLALAEAILPDSAAAMSWTVGDFGMKMTLARDVPERIASALRPFVLHLFDQAALDSKAQARTTFAIHPGGPKIIDRVRDILSLSEPQIQASRDVLHDYGNMSSATLPHVWQRLLDDANTPVGTPILSLAFGPGLSVCGGVFRKC